jgi:hypothetical protein
MHLQLAYYSAPYCSTRRCTSAQAAATRLPLAHVTPSIACRYLYLLRALQLVAVPSLARAMEVEHLDFSLLPPPPPPPSLGLRRASARTAARDGLDAGPELLQQQRRRSRSRSKHAGQYPPPPPPPPMHGSPLKRVASTDSLPSSSLLHQAQQARQPAAAEERRSQLAAEVHYKELPALH